MSQPRVSFARTLPVVSLLLALTMLAVPASMAYLNLRMASRHGSAVFLPQLHLTLQPAQFSRFALQAATETSSWAIQALNMPAFTVELGVSRCASSWPDTWLPRGMDFLTWRALSFPFTCLPFWWFAGLGLDALQRRRTLRWPVFLLGTLFCIGLIVILCGLTFGVPAADRTDVHFPYWGLDLWIALFGVVPVAWVRQRGRTQPVSNPR